MPKKKTGKTPNPIPTIGAEEMAIFQFIQQKSAATVREVADHFADHGKARTTVLTVMDRLRSKGLLSRKKVGASFQYQPCVEPSVVIQSMVKDFVRRVLGGSISPFTAYMSQSGEMTESEIQELKKVVAELEQKQIDSKANS
ncbi:BlaI/MecI/CopY family transcriptional regulator [Rubripirellula reticaptiva]|uniref:Methicillin resistance regulatory protein MecI n=1 Tax=Rubripirellula reticaptiva TaxID=2528013 RepID=A0A5C6EKZ9_9BACT|nr:BlaI/MecI/CopY family transcriptional regulator [Rubripirellula reticaptiva]TWU48261.1 Methicillin resistance regulatory protein MecI [Rubripirellula reticaptiva]